MQRNYQRETNSENTALASSTLKNRPNAPKPLTKSLKTLKIDQTNTKAHQNNKNVYKKAKKSHTSLIRIPKQTSQNNFQLLTSTPKINAKKAKKAMHKVKFSLQPQRRLKLVRNF